MVDVGIFFQLDIAGVAYIPAIVGILNYTSGQAQVSTGKVAFGPNSLFRVAAAYHPVAAEPAEPVFWRLSGHQMWIAAASSMRKSTWFTPANSVLPSVRQGRQQSVETVVLL